MDEGTLHVLTRIVKEVYKFSCRPVFIYKTPMGLIVTQSRQRKRIYATLSYIVFIHDVELEHLRLVLERCRDVEDILFDELDEGDTVRLLHNILFASKLTTIAKLKQGRIHMARIVSYQYV